MLKLNTIGLNLLWINSCWVKIYEAEEIVIFEESFRNANMSATCLSNIASLIAPKCSNYGIFDSMSDDIIKDSGVCLRSWFIRTDLSDALFLSV